MIWIVMQYVIDAFVTGFSIASIIALFVISKVMKIQAKDVFAVLDERERYRKIMLRFMLLNALLFVSYTVARILE